MYSKEEYYYKKDNLTFICCHAVQELFRNHWKLITGNEWTVESVPEFINGIGKEIYKEYKKKKLQKQYLQAGKVEDWDLTMMADILLRLETLKTEEEKAALTELRHFRNDVKHSAQNKTSAQEYQQAEETVRKCLSVLGFKQDKIDKLISHAGVTSSVVALETANNIRMFGDQEYLKGNYGRAIKFYDEALAVPSLLPVNLSSFFELRASCYLNLAQHEKDNVKRADLLAQALVDAKEAQNYHESSWKVHSTLAKIYRATNDWELAIQHFQTALAISPGQSDLRRELEDCQLLFGVLEREEHARIPKTLEEITERWSKISGLPITANSVLDANFPDELLPPGFNDVKTGHQHANGWNVKQSYQKAATFYQKASNKGNAEGTYNLALLYMEGDGVPKDLRFAIELLLRAANMPEDVEKFDIMRTDIGVRCAQHALGLKYQEGVGVKQDYKLAVKWYEKAAHNGCELAANNLAIMYAGGMGVKKDLVMAKHFWESAMQRGSSKAAFHLCRFYIDEMEPEKAVVMMERAIQLGHPRMPHLKNDVLRKVFCAKTARDALEEIVQNFEQAQNLEPGELTFRQRKDRLDIAGIHELTKQIRESHKNDNSINLDEDEVAENWAKLVKSNPLHLFSALGTNSTFLFADDKTLKWPGQYQFREEYYEKIKEKAKEGSETAHRILTTIGYNEFVIMLWQNGPPFSHSRAQNIIEFVYRRCCLEHQIFFVKSQEMLDGFYNFLKLMFEKHCGETGDLDKKIRVCYSIHFMETETQFAMKILLEATLRYPNEVIFYDFLTCAHGFLNQHKQGIHVCNQGLKLYPNDVSLWHSKAGHIRLDQKYENEESIGAVEKAYLDYLAVAPEDHRHVPEAYYQIAYCYVIRNSRRKIFEYFGKAQRAEELQLPCYLPYKCPVKTILQAHVVSLYADVIQIGENLRTTNVVSENLSSILTTDTKSYLKNPKRISTIKEHRKDLKAALDETNAPANIVTIQVPTRDEYLQPNLPQRLSGLEEITLQDMNPTLDKVYQDKVLTLTITEDPIIGRWTSFHSVAMDANKETIRLFVYKVPQNEEWRGKLGFGSRIAIFNPYLRVCNDQQNGIRVEGKSIFCLDKVHSMCRYCGEENAARTCSKCKWAKYCSRECQEADWKELKHKYICQ